MITFSAARIFAIPEDDLFSTSPSPNENLFLDGNYGSTDASVSDLTDASVSDLTDASISDLTDPSSAALPASEPQLNDFSLARECSSTSLSDQKISKSKARKRGSDVCHQSVYDDHDFSDEDRDFWDDFDSNRLLLNAIEHWRATNSQKLNLGLCPPPLLPVCCTEWSFYMGMEQFPCSPCK